MTNKQTGIRTNVKKDGLTNWQMDRWTDRQKGRWKDEQTDGQTNRQPDGQTDRRKDGKTDSPTDGLNDRQYMLMECLAQWYQGLSTYHLPPPSTTNGEECIVETFCKYKKNKRSFVIRSQSNFLWLHELCTKAADTNIFPFCRTGFQQIYSPDIEKVFCGKCIYDLVSTSP